MPYYRHYSQEIQFMAINFRTCPQTAIMLLREAIDTSWLAPEQSSVSYRIFSWGVHEVHHLLGFVDFNPILDKKRMIH